jgi:hypothetical protein
MIRLTWRVIGEVAEREWTLMGLVFCQAAVAMRTKLPKWGFRQVTSTDENSSCEFHPTY